MVAPLVAGAVVRTTGGLVLRRVAATSMGNALTGPRWKCLRISWSRYE